MAKRSGARKADLEMGVPAWDWVPTVSGNGRLPSSTGSRHRRTALIAAALLLGLVLGYLLGQQYSPSPQAGTSPLMRKAADGNNAAVKPAASAQGVLVLYSFFDGDEVSWDNLKFFVRHAVLPNDGGQYIVILNGVASEHDSRLPPLPGNARYVLHKNECYDWGTYAWALDSEVNQSDYSYFIFINSSVRGPLLPWYAQNEHHWTWLFTSKLNSKVKLVGPAISCEHFCIREAGAEKRTCRKNAHVQSVAVGTDMAGLQALRAAGYVLKCHSNRDHAIYYGEIGASLALLEAGFSIDSFLTRYQGVDWTDRATWQCNDAVSPIGKRTFDGVTASPLELVFPKLKGSLLESGVPSHFEADKLSLWLDQKASERNITSNWYNGDGGMLSRSEDVLINQRKGIDCFDWDYYAKKNPDVQVLPRPAQWVHFLNRGALEFREHRWKCGLDAQAIFDSIV